MTRQAPLRRPLCRQELGLLQHGLDGPLGLVGRIAVLPELAAHQREALERELEKVRSIEERKLFTLRKTIF